MNKNMSVLPVSATTGYTMIEHKILGLTYAWTCWAHCSRCGWKSNSRDAKFRFSMLAASLEVCLLAKKHSCKIEIRPQGDANLTVQSGRRLMKKMLTG